MAKQPGIVLAAFQVSATTDTLDASMVDVPQVQGWFHMVPFTFKGKFPKVRGKVSKVCGTVPQVDGMVPKSTFQNTGPKLRCEFDVMFCFVTIMCQ